MLPYSVVVLPLQLLNTNVTVWATKVIFSQYKWTQYEAKLIQLCNLVQNIHWLHYLHITCVCSPLVTHWGSTFMSPNDGTTVGRHWRTFHLPSNYCPSTGVDEVEHALHLWLMCRVAANMTCSYHLLSVQHLHHEQWRIWSTWLALATNNI